MRLKDIIQCMNCNSSDLFEDNDYIICNTCSKKYKIFDSVLYMNQRDDDYFDNYQQICTDDLQKEKTPSIVKKKLSQFILKNIENSARNKLICDFGSGDCFIINNIKENKKITIDIAPDYLHKCSNANFKINADLEHLPLRNNCIDIAICTDVLEHVIQDDIVIHNITNTIKKGGAFFVAFPWEQDLGVYDLPEYKEKFGKYKFVHLRTINEEYVSKKLIPHFKIEDELIIRDGMELMWFKPYPIKIYKLIKL